MNTFWLSIILAIFIIPHPSSAIVSFDERLSTDNPLVTPLGIYWPTNVSHVDIIANESLLNTVVFGYDSNTSFVDYDFPTMLTRCEQLQLHVLFELSYFLRWNDLAHLAGNITVLRTYPAISCWYLVDEPGNSQNGSLIAENDIIAAHTIVRQLDSRPTFVQFSNQLNVQPTQYDAIFDYVDYVSVDPYPQMPFLNYSYVDTQLTLLESFRNNSITHLWVVLVSEDSLQVDPITGYRIHSSDEFYIDTLLALNHNITGILWFYFGALDDPEFPYKGVYDFPQAWISYTAMIAKLRMYWSDFITGTFNKHINYSVRHGFLRDYYTVPNNNYYWNDTTNTTCWNPSAVSIQISATVENVLAKSLRTGDIIPIETNVSGMFINYQMNDSGDIFAVGLVSVMSEIIITTYPMVLLMMVTITLSYLFKHKIHKKITMIE